MKILTTQNATEIRYYASAGECPIERHIHLQKWLAVESGIGSSIDAISNRFLKIKAFIEEQRYSDALLENENAYKATISAIEGVSYLSMAFACMVAEIGGQCVDDLTEDGLMHTVDMLKSSQVTYDELKDAVEEIKKKIDEELTQFYPGVHSTIDNLIYLSRMKVYIISTASAYCNLEPSADDLEQLKHDHNWFLVDGGARNFRSGDEQNVTCIIERNFISLCAQMEENGSSNPRKYTVLEFYGKIDYLDKRQIPDG